MDTRSHIDKAVELAGGTQAKLAGLVGYSQQGISKAQRSGRASWQLAILLEKQFPDEFSKSELRPDIFGEPAE